ncbi:MAG: DUF4838 domain-containing protein [Armatimonadota bacterium]
MSFRIIAVAALLAAGIASAASAMTLASEGKAQCSIVISKDATAPQLTAAKELQSYLNQVTGAEFAIRRESQVKPDAPQILVGPSSRLKKLASGVDWSALGHDGIVIRTVENKLLLAGGEPRGTLYAVYTFLEDTVGCRWWSGTESDIPTIKNLTIPALDTVYTPKLRYREAYYRDLNENPLFAARLKLNGHFYKIPPAYGDHYKILGWCHTAYELLPPDKYFKDHPEWYSEIDGKRQYGHGQLCWTNDEMRKELTKVALSWIEKDPTAGIISISQNDWHGACQCAKCKAVEAEEQSQAGPLIRCLNQVAEDIEKQYPDMLVETLAYQYTRKPPAKVKPRKNVVIRLCTIECDFSKPLDSDGNPTFRDDIRKWSAIAPNLYIWDYVTDFASYIQPHPNMRVLAPNLRFFVDNNTIGVFEQGDAGCSIGDFVRLRAWVLAHLEWDPSRDANELIKEFVNGYYGPAAPYILKYLNLVHDSIDQNPMPLSCYNGNLSFMSLAVMTESTRLFNQALRACADAPVALKRVQRDKLSLDHVWLKKYDELKAQAKAENVRFAGPADLNTGLTQFIEAAHSWNVGNYSESWPFELYEASLEARFAGPPPSPTELAALPKSDVVEIKAGKLKLYEPPKWARIVDDPKASSGKAAFMEADHTQWAIQHELTKSQAKSLKGSWRWYLIARAEGAKSGNAFEYGVYDGPSHRNVTRFTAKLQDSADGEYHTFYLGKIQSTAGLYAWVAPMNNSDAVKGIYVEKIVLVKATD